MQDLRDSSFISTVGQPCKGTNFTKLTNLTNFVFIVSKQNFVNPKPDDILGRAAESGVDKTIHSAVVLVVLQLSL